MGQPLFFSKAAGAAWEDRPMRGPDIPRFSTLTHPKFSTLGARRRKSSPRSRMSRASGKDTQLLPVRRLGDALKESHKDTYAEAYLETQTHPPPSSAPAIAA
jgi:hypothetical protein